MSEASLQTWIHEVACDPTDDITNIYLASVLSFGADAHAAVSVATRPPGADTTLLAYHQTVPESRGS